MSPRGDVQMFGAGLSKKPVRRPRTTCGATRRSRRVPLLAAVALVLGALAVTPPATAANAVGTGFTGVGSGTFASANGTLYARQGAPLTLTVTTDSAAQCLEVVDGNNKTMTFGDGQTHSVWSFSDVGNYPWLVAGSGNGLVSYTLNAFKNYNSSQQKCTGAPTNTFPVQTASYVLDNAAPTATGVLSPTPNGAKWNKSDVTVTWTGNDNGGSGVKTLTPAGDTVTTDGTTTRTTTVTDNVGNSATSAPVTVNLDKTAPTITGSRTPAANANGWNNTDVTVSFTPADATSGVKSASVPTTLTGNGANQSVTGTVSDNADNTASTTVSGINIDKVAPTLSGKPTSDPNGAGWFNRDVTIAWTATDTLSGTSAPADSTITGEGAGLTAVASATDKAGNSSGSVQSAPVKIDRTAPHTTVSAPPAWNKTDVTLSLVADDALSGVAATHYALDGGAASTGTSVPVSSEGRHTLEFWSTDQAGNDETHHTVEFGIDKTSPTIGHTQDPAANAAGWNNTDVTVTFSCSDALSGVADCTAPRQVTDEGRSQAVTGTVTDNAGNSAADPATVSIDRTPPHITVDDLPAPNERGWYAAPVTTTWTATDQLSGVASQDRAHTFGEGADQTATGTATDAADNSASATTPRVSVDTTAPTISGRVLAQPGAQGWYDGDVTVHWTCDDNLSGVVSCPDDSIVTGEGSSLATTVGVSDRADNASYATVDGIRIDRTAPTTSATGVPGGWVNAPVTVGLSASDNLSDVDSTWYAVDGGDPVRGSRVTVGSEGVHTVSYWSVDRAGNREAAQSYTVRLDLTSPDITPGQVPEANANGWNNTDVSVSFACEDQTGLSGLADCPEPRTISTEGRAQRVTGTATDHAGNRTSGSAIVNIDKTAPTLTGAADRPANAAGWYDDDVTVAFDAHDALSGIDQVTAPQHLGEGADQSVRGTATDNAGNSTDAAVTGINVDETAPDLSAAPTTLPNENGWYNTDVTEVWAAADSLSGLAGDRPANAVLTAEGRGQTVSATVRDLAGNATGATSEPVDIDKTAPTTDASAPSGWSNGAVEVTLTPHDALSGVASTEYRVDGGAPQHGTSVTLDNEGTHTIAYASTDEAGNTEREQIVTVHIDRSAPTITHSLSPHANTNGWNNSDVTVTFECADQADLSGIASCTTPQDVTTEGKDQPVVGHAADNAGNTATDPATVSLDKTKPTITGSRTPAANDFGWNRSDVTVHFDGKDGLSGIDSVTADKTFGEGSDQSLEGTAVDAAGNSAGTTVAGINVDETAPTLRGAPTAEPDQPGWYRGDVTVRWAAGDDRSGVADAPADSTITGEGTGLRATATVSDRAGNSTTADSVPVNIDRTPPATGADAPGGWNNTQVTVSLDAADGLSGLDATYYEVDGGARHQGSSLTIDTEGVHSLRYWSVDNAGNVEPAHDVTVRIDLTAPGIRHEISPAPNSSGWSNRPVTVSWSCDDALSGIATCPEDVPVGTDGQGQDVSGTAVDKAGNTRTDHASVSIDSVDPTISGTPDRPANAHGWYDADVTVGFACDDAISGIADCTAPVRLGEGEGQLADGTATDAAGNRQRASVGPIDVDKTAPTLTGDVTSPPNDAGWYDGDVTVHWTAADALSGLDGPAPADSTISSEGRGLTAGATVRDLAGNQTSASSPPIKVDRTAPTTTVSDVSAWSNDAVTVDLTATDNLSGVAATHYRLDDEAPADGSQLTIDAEGVHTLQVWSTDVAGNVEARQDMVVRIDRTAPGITHTQAPAPNGRGWNNSDVTVTFTCTDDASGVAVCTDPVTRGEGAAQKVVGTARDVAGNTATDETTVNVDESRPTVTGSLSSSPNANGWFNADVVATFTCADQAGLSGVRSCPDAQRLGEGRAQSAGGTATDAADNVSDPLHLTGIDVDETRPTLSGAATTAPNENGWYRGDVTVHWTAADALSGIDGGGPADTTVTGEGDDLAASAAVSDLAGNTRAATLGGIRIDRTPPSTDATAPAGWQNTDVTVRFAATDALSGVAATRYSVDGRDPQDGSSVTLSAEGTHQVTYWSVDRAGNREVAKTVTVLVDKTPPTITGRATTSPNGAGWYRTPVTVAFQCQDSVSGISSCQPDTTVATQGTNSVTGIAVDNAGNKGTTTVGGLNVDTVAPGVTISGVKDGATYTLGAVPTATVSASDATSGLAAPARLTTSGGLANGVGTFTVTGTATDRAGNVGNATATYRVVYGYGSTLFLQPVNDTAHQTGLSTSVFNAGQAVPMKFQLRNAAGQVVQAGSAPTWLVPVKGSSTGAAVNESAYSATATAGSTYTWDGSQYAYTWKTDKSQAGSYWRVGVALDDGQTYYVNIGLR